MGLKIATCSLFMMTIFIGFNLISARWTSKEVQPGFTQTGICSWYGDPNNPAEIGLTANGEHFDGTSMTAASKVLPYNTVVSVTGKNNKTCTVRINDNGPCCGRPLDLSRAAALLLDVIDDGIWKCTVTVLSVP